MTARRGTDIQVVIKLFHRFQRHARRKGLFRGCEADGRFAGPRPRAGRGEERRGAIRAAYRAPEPVCVPPLIEEARLDPALSAKVQSLAHGLVSKMRAERGHAFGVEALMKEFSLSTPEGVALMCLAESLLRIPDNETRDRSHSRQARARRLGRACGRKPVLVRECVRLGIADHRQACRDQQRAWHGSFPQPRPGPGRRAGHPQGHGPRDAASRPAVRDRQDDRGGARACPALRGARVSLFLRHAGRGRAHRRRRRQLHGGLRACDPRYRQRE